MKINISYFYIMYCHVFCSSPNMGVILELIIQQSQNIEPFLWLHTLEVRVANR